MLLGLLFVGCGSSELGDVTNSASSVPESGQVDSNDDETLVTPAVGVEVEVPFLVDSDCRAGSVEAFGVEWRTLELAPLEWELLEVVDGSLRFESFDLAVFTANGETVEMTYSIGIEEECIVWE